MHPLHALEKHHFHFSAFIGHNGAETRHHIVFQFVRREFRAVFGVQAHLHYRCAHLHLGYVRVDICNTDNAAAVYVTERIQAHKIPHGGYPQLMLEKFRPFGPHPGEVLYGRIQIHTVQI